jgi:malate dehydrogenase (oxaloacetate-decarboxylating)
VHGAFTREVIEAMAAALLPGMENLREICTAVAAAVYHAAIQDAVATKEHHDLVRTILDAMWIPEYQTGEEI